MITFLHFIPISLVISLVYNCTRYEATDLIIKRSVRMFGNILLFMALMTGVLMSCSIGL